MGKCDLLLHNALIFDGSGSEPFYGDVGITGGKITRIAPCLTLSAREHLDVKGLALAPGFIDSHSHDDLAILIPEHIYPKITQGVTTVVTGNCGFSVAPLKIDGEVPRPLDLLGQKTDFIFPSFSLYTAALKQGACIRSHPLIGHGSLRVACVEDLKRPANASELKRMLELLETSLQNGAKGLSTGLAYPINCGASYEELLSLSQLTAKYGATLSVHVRDEYDGLLEALDEVIKCANECALTLILSHQKAAGNKNRGKAATIIERYHTLKQEYYLDAYPYIAGSTILEQESVGQSTKVVISWSKAHSEVSGMELGEIAKTFGLSIDETIAKLQPAGAIYFHMTEADVDTFLKLPNCMIGSDGLARDTHPHPRLWGAFPRVLGHYVRDRKLLSLAEAIRKMTSLPAKAYALQNRGSIKEGYVADLVVFSPEKIDGVDDFLNPRQSARGIEMVFLGGKRILPKV